MVKFNWQWLNTGCKGGLSDMEFVNTSTGYAAGTAWDRQTKKFVGEIIKTTDGGQSWQKIHTVTNNIMLMALDFVSVNVGFVVGGEGTILKTTDGGNNWVTISTPTTNTLTDIYFVNASVGYAVGAVGTILKTTDGGNSWSLQTPPVISTFNAINVPAVGVGYMVGDGPVILKGN